MSLRGTLLAIVLASGIGGGIYGLWSRMPECARLVDPRCPSWASPCYQTIQGAINALNADTSCNGNLTGRVVYVMPGTYTENVNVTGTETLHLIGLGNSRWIRNNVVIQATVDTAADPILHWNGPSGNLMGFMLDFVNSSDAGDHGLHIDAVGAALAVRELGFIGSLPTDGNAIRIDPTVGFIEFQNTEMILNCRSGSTGVNIAGVYVDWPNIPSFTELRFMYGLIELKQNCPGGTALFEFDRTPSFGGAL
ncbi:MAG: hypothetical protein R3344_11885, partial [Acidobacteriota bacterium]|nr:hypothetical protein [Acidobacteriota bacterium]